MNIHVILILLAFQAPASKDAVPLLEQPQISAPLTMKEETSWLWYIRSVGWGN